MTRITLHTISTENSSLPFGLSFERDALLYIDVTQIYHEHSVHQHQSLRWKQPAIIHQVRSGATCSPGQMWCEVQTGLLLSYATPAATKYVNNQRELSPVMNRIDWRNQF